MVMERFALTERRACRIVGQPRASQRYIAMERPEEGPLVRSVIELATQYGRYGYRIVTGLLNLQGWKVGKDRVYRIWRQEGLKVPKKQKPRGRLWLNDGSCIRLRPLFPNHVWSYDFVSFETHDRKKVRALNIVDEFTRECLAIYVARHIRAQQVIETLADLMIERGTPAYIRSDNGPEFIAKRLRAWLGRIDVKPLYIEPGSPWENGYVESFNGKFRYEVLDAEIFYSLKEAQIVIEQWRNFYNHHRPHSSLGYRPPAPQGVLASTPCKTQTSSLDAAQPCS